MMFATMSHGIATLRGGREDVLTDAAAGTAAGVIFKSTRGLRAAGKTGAVFGLFAGSVSLLYRWYTDRPLVDMH